MTRKTPSPHPPPAPAAAGSAKRSRRALLAGAAGAVLVAGIGGLAVVRNRRAAQDAALAQRPALASREAPSLGPDTARVRIVEFMDPACETCAVFYPLVKQILAGEPARLRLSLRHVPLHPGSELVVALLEASREQGLYWQTMEALLSTQNQWVPRHVVMPERVWNVVGGLGLDRDRLRTAMAGPEVSRRMAQDRDDARALQVEQTPEYFVNGRQMASFGRQQLQNLIAEALSHAYS